MQVARTLTTSRILESYNVLELNIAASKFTGLQVRPHLHLALTAPWVSPRGGLLVILFGVFCERLTW